MVEIFPALAVSIRFWRAAGRGSSCGAETSTGLPGSEAGRQREALLLQLDERFSVFVQERRAWGAEMFGKDKRPEPSAHRHDGSATTEGFLPTVQFEILPDDRN